MSNFNERETAGGGLGTGGGERRVGAESSDVVLGETNSEQRWRAANAARSAEVARKCTMSNVRDCCAQVCDLRCYCTCYQAAWSAWNAARRGEPTA